MAARSETFSVSNPARSQPARPALSSDSERLTNAEIEALRRGKKQISGFARKAFTGWAAKKDR